MPPTACCHVPSPPSLSCAHVRSPSPTPSHGCCDSSSRLFTARLSPIRRFSTPPRRARPDTSSRCHPFRWHTSRCARRHDQLGHPGFRRPGDWASPYRVGRGEGGDPGIFDRCLLPTIRFTKNGHPRVSVYSALCSHTARELSVHADELASANQPHVTEHFTLRTCRTGVPLTLRHRAPHRAEALTEVKPPPWRDGGPRQNAMSIESAR